MKTPKRNKREAAKETQKQLPAKLINMVKSKKKSPAPSFSTELPDQVV